MPFNDFRAFLAALRAAGEHIDVDCPVALELEVAKAMRKSAAIAVAGIDATFPFGAEIRTAGARPVSRDICGPSTSRSPMCRGGGSMSFRS
jgi:hypothetical protein